MPTFLELKAKKAIDRNTDLQKIIKNNAEFSNLYDSCANRTERKMLVAWLVEYFTDDKCIEALDFIATFNFTGDDIKDEYRRYSLLKLLDDHEVLRSEIKAVWDIGSDMLELFDGSEYKNLSKLVTNLQYIFASEIELLERGKFPQVSKQFMLHICGSQSFFVEDFALFEKQNSELAPLETKRRFKIIAFFLMLFKNRSRVEVTIESGVLSVAACEEALGLAIDSGALNPPQVIINNLRRIFFGGNRNVFFAKVLMDHPEVVQELLTSQKAIDYSANFAKLLKLTDDPLNFLDRYSKYASESAICESVIHVANAYPSDVLAKFWLANVTFFRTVGVVSKSYISIKISEAAKPVASFEDFSERDQMLVSGIFSAPSLSSHFGFTIDQLMTLLAMKTLPVQIINGIAGNATLRDMVIDRVETDQKAYEFLRPLALQCPRLSVAILNSEYTSSVTILALTKDTVLMNAIAKNKKLYQKAFALVRARSKFSYYHLAVCSDVFLEKLIQDRHKDPYFFTYFDFEDDLEFADKLIKKYENQFEVLFDLSQVGKWSNAILTHPQTDPAVLNRLAQSTSAQAFFVDYCRTVGNVSADARQANNGHETADKLMQPIKDLMLNNDAWLKIIVKDNSLDVGFWQSIAEDSALTEKIMIVSKDDLDCLIALMKKDIFWLEKVVKDAVFVSEDVVPVSEGVARYIAEHIAKTDSIYQAIVHNENRNMFGSAMAGLVVLNMSLLDRITQDVPEIIYDVDFQLIVKKCYSEKILLCHNNPNWFCVLHRLQPLDILTNNSEKLTGLEIDPQILQSFRQYFIGSLQELWFQKVFFKTVSNDEEFIHFLYAVPVENKDLQLKILDAYLMLYEQTVDENLLSSLGAAVCSVFDALKGKNPKFFMCVISELLSRAAPGAEQDALKVSEDYIKAGAHVGNRDSINLSDLVRRSGYGSPVHSGRDMQRASEPADPDSSAAPAYNK